MNSMNKIKPSQSDSGCVKNYVSIVRRPKNKRTELFGILILKGEINQSLRTTYNAKNTLSEQSPPLAEKSKYPHLQCTQQKNQCPELRWSESKDVKGEARLLQCQFRGTTWSSGPHVGNTACSVLLQSSETPGSNKPRYLKNVILDCRWKLLREFSTHPAKDGFSSNAYACIYQPFLPIAPNGP